MLDELVKILTREEKEHVVEEIDSHMSQVHYRYDNGRNNVWPPFVVFVVRAR